MARTTLAERIQDLIAEKRMRRISRSLSHFILHGIDDDELPLDAAHIEQELVEKQSTGLFLDFYSASGLETALREYGLWARLEGRGHLPRVEIGKEGAWRHLFRLRDGRLPPGEDLLVELCARTVTLAGCPGGIWPAALGTVDVLAIEWLLMQDPRRSFTPERPPLPGQVAPGLGLGREVMSLLEIMTDRLGREGLIAVPQHYHNGFLYDRRFRFIDPAREGELHALERDLEGLDLATASWAVELGLVHDLVSGEPYRWRAEEMIRPMTDRLREWFERENWRDARRGAFQARRFAVDHDRLPPIREALAAARRPGEETM